MTTDDEILIQRCVDDEATPEERRRMMQRLDDLPDGWKTLACSFLEEQLFARATRAECSQDIVNPAQPASAPDSKVHWFYHPMMSLALSVCVAFMAGVLIRGQLQGPNSVSVADAPADTKASGTGPGESESGSDRVPDAAAGLVADDGVYKVRLMENDEPGIELPVYSLKDYAQRSREHWRNSERFGAGSPDRESTVRTIWLSAPDGHVYVIPVEEFSAPWMQ